MLQPYIEIATALTDNCIYSPYTGATRPVTNNYIICDIVPASIAKAEIVLRGWPLPFFPMWTKTFFESYFSNRLTFSKFPVGLLVEFID